MKWFGSVGCLEWGEVAPFSAKRLVVGCFLQQPTTEEDLYQPKNFYHRFAFLNTLN